jgi:hypothetical protein
MDFTVCVLADAFTKETITIKLVGPFPWNKKCLDQQCFIYLPTSRNIWGYLVFKVEGSPQVGVLWRLERFFIATLVIRHVYDPYCITDFTLELKSLSFVLVAIFGSGVPYALIRIWNIVRALWIVPWCHCLCLYQWCSPRIQRFVHTTMASVSIFIYGSEVCSGTFISVILEVFLGN